MANEWVKVELLGPNRDGEPRTFTVADGLAVSQGQLMTLTDERTCAAVAYGTVPLMFAGVAAEDHTANVGVTRISLWTNGIFEASCSGGIALGQNVTGTAVNHIIGSAALTVASGANILGYSMEVGTADEVINVRLRL